MERPGYQEMLTNAGKMHAYHELSINVAILKVFKDFDLEFGYQLYQSKQQGYRTGSGCGIHYVKICRTKFVHRQDV